MDPVLIARPRLVDMGPMRLRAPVPDDAPAVLAVIAARDTADLGAPDCTLGDLRDEWRLSDFDLASDAVVVEAEDRRIVGYSIVRGYGTLAVVAPEAEGQGVGALLLPWAELKRQFRALQVPVDICETLQRWGASPDALEPLLRVVRDIVFSNAVHRAAMKRAKWAAGAAYDPHHKGTPEEPLTGTEPQLFVWLKSPLVAMAVTGAAAVPVLVIVTACAALEPPVATEPNDRAVGLMERADPLSGR